MTKEPQLQNNNQPYMRQIIFSEIRNKTLNINFASNISIVFLFHTCMIYVIRFKNVFLSSSSDNNEMKAHTTNYSIQLKRNLCKYTNIIIYVNCSATFFKLNVLDLWRRRKKTCLIFGRSRIRKSFSMNLMAFQS